MGENDSPFGAVDDEEILARFVNLERDDLVDNNNKIQEGVLPTSELMSTSGGWSLCRKKHVSSMTERVRQHAKTGTKGQRYGYALVRALDARQIKDSNGEQAFCIIADPIEGDPAHAIAKRARDYRREELRYIRGILLKKFSEVKTGDN